MKMKGFFLVCTMVCCLPVPDRGLRAQDPVPLSDSLVKERIRMNADSLFNGEWFIGATGYRKQDSTGLDSVHLDHRRNTIRVYADPQLAYAPFRPGLVDSLETGMRYRLGERFGNYSIELFSAGHSLRTYIPNYYRERRREMDRERMVRWFRRRSAPLVLPVDRPLAEEPLLTNHYIALWHSHGWYYEPSLHRWEWQRARIFQTVEDIYPMAFTLQMLVPMLENAGATVLLPRERDWQVREVIVDNNGSTGKSRFLHSGGAFPAAGASGFAIGKPPYTTENPFRLGTSMKMEAAKDPTDTIRWIPDIPETGEYAVYVSYHRSDGHADDARYLVRHLGGTTRFRVNQQMGGGTWIYLGRFGFARGIDPYRGSVILTNRSGQRRATVGADAVRFGGGMGNIARNGLTGRRPRYQEAARYYLQYAGFPDTLVWKLNAPANDYTDDYQSRGEWVNYLMGSPSGPAADREVEGLGIPVDLSLAFHTDAGISGSDTVIGTLGIYSTRHDEGMFPGRDLSRMASRDLTDLIQTQIVSDIRAGYDPQWTRRAMWDRGYSEAYRPNVPAMLLELASHQNFIDIRFGQEPLFRFDVARAIYKGMLSFLHSVYGTEYVVQPLPVTHFRTGFTGGGGIRLSWRPQADTLEPTASPDHYIVYTRINDGGFDNGRLVEDTVCVVDRPMPDSIYSFRVAAANRGGEGFPSEVLSACVRSESRGDVLIINAFDRTGGAAWFDDETHAGFLPMVDQGVPFREDLHTVGWQYDYVKASPWLDDDSPGHGASYADLEALVIPGNSFDFSYTHGLSIRQAGYSFVSASDETVREGNVHMPAYDVVDFLAGEEKTVYLPKNDSAPRFRVLEDAMLSRLERYLQQGGGLFISGAHVATDIHDRGQDSLAASLLGYTWRTSNASRLGAFYFMDPFFAPLKRRFAFNTGYHPELYTVEGADALEPADSTSVTLIRYAENNMSGGVVTVGRPGIVATGFPFESIIGRDDRDYIMERILKYLTKTSAYEQD